MLHELELARIRATTACDVFTILQHTKLHSKQKVTDFRYKIMEIKEIIKYLEKEIQMMEKDVESSYQETMKLEVKA